MGEETVTIPKSEYEALKILKTLVEQLAKRVNELEEEIRLLKNGRSSKTSSTPPSQDMGRSNHTSLREKSGKPSGGQAGHGGNTLKKSARPDEILIHQSAYCRKCARSWALLKAPYKKTPGRKSR